VLDVGTNKDGGQGNSSRAAARKQVGLGGEAEEASLEVFIDKDQGPPFCHRCKSVGHLVKDCRQDRGPDGADGRGIVLDGGPEKSLSEYIAPLCTIQVDGHAFFCIPDRPSHMNARERVNTAIVTVLKGEVTTKQVEDVFTRIQSGPWRWTARRVDDNKFIVRFPNA
jgi:hypothetical protein